MNVTLDIQLPNFQNARIMDSNGSIFLLNGVDLFAIDMDAKSQSISNLRKIGRLDGVENQTISDIKVKTFISLRLTDGHLSAKRT